MRRSQVTVSRPGGPPLAGYPPGRAGEERGDQGGSATGVWPGVPERTSQPDGGVGGSGAVLKAPVERTAQ